MTNASLNFEINNLPKSIRDEIKDFVDFLKLKNSKEKKITKREFGFGKGKVKLSNDFDDPLDEFKEYLK
jgi:outer membrane protein OmpA-like peptidoglycan-associated protein